MDAEARIAELERELARVRTDADRQCDRCNMCPIVGPRWRCRDCADYDLCETCWTGLAKREGSFHDCSHTFEEVKAKATEGARHIKVGAFWRLITEEEAAGLAGTSQAIDNARLREALEAKLAVVDGAVEAVAEPPRELPAIEQFREWMQRALDDCDPAEFTDEQVERAVASGSLNRRAVSKSVAQRLEFSNDDLDALGAGDLPHDCHIEAGGQLLAPLFPCFVPEAVIMESSVFPRGGTMPDFEHPVTGQPNVNVAKPYALFDHANTCFVFLSHRWLRPKHGAAGHPDDAMAHKLDLIKQALPVMRGPQKEVPEDMEFAIWSDFACIDQDDGDPAAQLNTTMLMLMAHCDVVLIPVVDIHTYTHTHTHTYTHTHTHTHNMMCSGSRGHKKTGISGQTQLSYLAKETCFS